MYRIVMDYPRASKVDAIKWHRRLTGKGLKEAKAEIDGIFTASCRADHPVVSVEYLLTEPAFAARAAMLLEALASMHQRARSAAYAGREQLREGAYSMADERLARAVAQPVICSFTALNYSDFETPQFLVT